MYIYIYLFNCPKIKNISPSDLIVIYYVLNNNFYTQLAFAFVPQKDSYYAFFFSSLVKF